MLSIIDMSDRERAKNLNSDISQTDKTIFALIARSNYSALNFNLNHCCGVVGGNDALSKLVQRKMKPQKWGSSGRF